LCDRRFKKFHEKEIDGKISIPFMSFSKHVTSHNSMPYTFSLVLSRYRNRISMIERRRDDCSDGQKEFV